MGADEGLNTYYSLEMEAAGRFWIGVICQKMETFSPRENPTSQKMLIVEISFHIPYASCGGVVLFRGATLDLSPIPHPTVRRGWRSLNSTDVGTSWRYRPHGGPGALYACPITSERTDGFYMKYCINVMPLGTTLLVYRISSETYSRSATQDVSPHATVPTTARHWYSTSPVPDRSELNFRSILISDFYVRLGKAGSQH